MKTILAIWHSSNRGKSDTLRHLANQLLALPRCRILDSPSMPLPVDGDFRLVVKIHGKIIGIETQGDPNTNLEQRLKVLALKFKCDVILCTSRTRGETVAAVENIAATSGYEAIWTSTYQMTNPRYNAIVNECKAKHVYDLLQRLGRI